jgi:acyl-CoA dehydrogenase
MFDRFIEQMPFFTDAQRKLAQDVRNLVAREIEPRMKEEFNSGEAQDVRLFAALLADQDLLRYTIAAPPAPNADDRRAPAMDVRALCLIREALAYSSSLADLAFVMQGLGTYAISRAAPEHVRDFWLERAAKGRAIAAFALTEPEAGSDVAAIKTMAARDGDAYVINGRKRFISNAGVADFYTVFARTSTREDGRSQISAFVVSIRLAKSNLKTVACPPKIWSAQRAMAFASRWRRSIIFARALAQPLAVWRAARSMKRLIMRRRASSLDGPSLNIN